MVSAGRHALRQKPRSPDWYAPPAVITAADCLKTTAAVELAEIHESARRLGQICFPLQNYRKKLAQSLARRMSQRLGDFIYQSAAFSLETGQLSSPSSGGDPAGVHAGSTDNSLREDLEGNYTHSKVMAMVSPLIGLSGYACAGGARALRTPSERVVRVVAMIVPDIEISWVASQGMERLYVNFQYVLADEDGEVHPPKDSDRRELELGEVTELRQNLRSPCTGRGSRCTRVPTPDGTCGKIPNPGNKGRSRRCEQRSASPPTRFW